MNAWEKKAFKRYCFTKCEKPYWKNDKTLKGGLINARHFNNDIFNFS